MTTTALHPVDDFARAVRAALADLSADEVDELTDGLEADLAERAADQDSPEFGDAITYANELRSAAGLPYRRRSSGLKRTVDSVKAWQRKAASPVRSNIVGGGILDFLASLRPVWWIYRGWAIFLWSEFALRTGIHAVPVTALAAIVFAAAMIVSVQFGRGKWMPWLWLRVAVTVANAALVIATPFLAVWAISSIAWRYL
jgi:hypothetical protein